MIDRIIRLCNQNGVKKENITNIFSYGSRVYGTATYQSDYDFIVINTAGVNDREIRNGDYNIHLYTVDHFQNMITNHKIFALECLFLSDTHILLNNHSFSFIYNENLLRKEISFKSSNSWVKCKKKLTVEKDCEYIGLKSLFHSLRIIVFGIQLAKHKKIIDFTEANHFFTEIMLANTYDWTYYKDNYQSVFNALSTEFKKLAEKSK